MLWVQTGNGVAITTNRSIEEQNPHVVIRDIDVPEAKIITSLWHGVRIITIRRSQFLWKCLRKN